jgi:hypothetical protein
LSQAEKMHESQGIRTDRTTRPPPIQGSNPAGGGGRDISVATSSSRADNSSDRRRSRGEISLRSGATSASGQGSRVTLANSHSHPSAEFLPPPPGPTRHRDGDADPAPPEVLARRHLPMLAAVALRRVSYSPRILGPALGPPGERAPAPQAFRRAPDSAEAKWTLISGESVRPLCKFGWSRMYPPSTNL